MPLLLPQLPAFVVALFLTTLSMVSAEHFAVLVCGSHTYGNYRHHADVAHAYHVAVSGGIKKQNIIVMMYDDVVNDIENPFPGQLFNKPTPAGTPGIDVYHGVPKDYTGNAVTAVNFLAVLTGNKTAMKNIGSGRVLESTSTDRVFINFVDHGGVGLIAFPNQPYLYKKDLHNALIQMYNTSMYKELVFYLEACESGSMFQDFPTDKNVYITTAANAKESSWGTYCAPHDLINGTNLNTCLGDLYSVNWLENSETSNTKKETLNEQYTKVKKLTNKSHVMQFGDIATIGAEPVADFIGNDDPTRHASNATVPASVSTTSEVGHFDSRDHELNRFFYAYARTEDPREADRLIQEIKSRVTHRSNIEQIAMLVTHGSVEETARLMDVNTYSIPIHDACHKQVNMAYAEYCGGFTDYSLKFVRVIVNMCEQKIVEGETTMEERIQHMVQAVATVCGG